MTRLNVYLLTVAFDGAEQEYEAIALESEPLLGMTFLEGHEVCLQVIEGGTIRIAAL